jgi:hypothetical protein
MREVIYFDRRLQRASRRPRGAASGCVDRDSAPDSETQRGSDDAPIRYSSTARAH